MPERENAFDIYNGKETELISYTSCGGCPGGNIEYAHGEMSKNKVDVIHLATGMVVGYPPCPRINLIKIGQNKIRKLMNHRIAIAIEELPGNNYIVAENFRGCSKFVIYEIDSNKIVVQKETYFNPLNGHQKSQSQLPGYINQFDVNYIMVGVMDKKTLLNFQKYGIGVIKTPRLQIKDVLEQFLTGKLNRYIENFEDNN